MNGIKESTRGQVKPQPRVEPKELLSLEKKSQRRLGQSRRKEKGSGGTGGGTQLGRNQPKGAEEAKKPHPSSLSEDSLE